jgi:G3E family GTPase
MADIPVYLVAGFLDAGKTNFINGILEDGFARQEPTLLLCCEEGEEEYEKNALDNVTVVTFEDEEDLKCSRLKELEKQYHPKQVLIEYNGMWQMERLYREVLPANWVLYQIMTFVHAPTFEMYAKNMGHAGVQPLHAGAAGRPAQAEPPHGEPPGGHLSGDGGRHQRGLPHRGRVPLRP